MDPALLIRIAILISVVLKRGLALTLTGLAIGLALAAIAARSMTALLYGFRPWPIGPDHGFQNCRQELLIARMRSTPPGLQIQ